MVNPIASSLWGSYATSSSPSQVGGHAFTVPFLARAALRIATTRFGRLDLEVRVMLDGLYAAMARDATVESGVHRVLTIDIASRVLDRPLEEIYEAIDAAISHAVCVDDSVAAAVAPPATQDVGRAISLGGIRKVER